MAANSLTVKDNFAAWFRDSRIVDAHGSPLIVFHGTNQPIERFSFERLGTSTASASSRLGIWFTDSPSVAGEYADKASRTLVHDEVNHDAINARFLKDIAAAERRGNWDLAEKLTARFEAHDIGAIQAGPSGQNVMPVFLSMQRPFIVDVKGDSQTTGLGAEIMCQAQATGHDGVVFLNTTDTDSFTVSHHYTVFKPEQVKSVNNCGLFLSASCELTDLSAQSALISVHQARRVTQREVPAVLARQAHRSLFSMGRHP